MNNDNRNKDITWQSKLDALDGLPGEVFNKNAAWNKLRARESKKKKFIKPVWYYVAAACIIIIFLLSSFWPDKVEKVLVKNSDDRTPDDKSAAIISKNNHKDSVVTESLPPLRHEVDNTIKEQKSTLTLKEDDPGTKDNIIVRNEILSKPLSNEVIETVITEKSSTDIIAIPPVFQRKKLTVVHINELGEIPEQPIVARKTEARSFSLKFGNQEIFTNPSIPSIKDGFTIFSTKNSPN